MNNSSLSKSSLNKIYSIIHHLNIESQNKVLFGKYKNKTYEVVYQDSNYCRWICKQNPSNIDMLLLKQWIEKKCNSLQDFQGKKLNNLI